MGEVFKARDTRLGRTVAIKVLPPEFAQDRDRALRLRREASAISQLNHPHICTLYDVGSDNGVEYLVMEYLDGHSLADRLTKGALPVDDVLRIGAEVADALHRAHTQGIVHRDLKPSNIMLTKSGVKLLDFGLAKSLSSGPDTATEHRPLTQEGALLGTLHYMSPEQLEGRAADARSDIFALGAVLYEMATGRRAFEGTQPVAPPALDHIIRKCLEKKPDQRWQSAWDVAEQLRWLDQTTAEPVAKSSREKYWKVASLILLAALLAAAGFISMRERRRNVESIRLALTPPAGMFIGSVTQRPFSVSPDGKYIVFMTQAMTGGLKVAMCLRRLSEPTARVIEDNTTSRAPFWSADSRFIGYFADGQLKRMALSGGTPETICADANINGASWGPAGTIVYANDSGVYSVRAEGGTPRRLLAPTGGEIYFDPVVLPDGDHYLLTRYDQDRNGSIILRSIRDRSSRVVLRNATNATWIASGYILFVRGEILMGQRFDLRRYEVKGDPVVISEKVGVLRRETMNALYSTSRDGRVLALQPSLSHDTRLVRVNWDSDTEAELAGPARIWFPSVSRDGAYVAYMVEQPNGDADIWTIDLVRGVTMRVTSEPTHDTSPVWSPDRKWIAYASDHGIYRIPAAGGPRELLLKTDVQTGLTDWSPDGQTIVFRDDPGPSSDIKALRLADRKVIPVVATRFRENWGRLSPDGEWIAYQSNESNVTEVYVQRFRDGAFKTRVSKSGGTEPRWSRDGRKIYYIPWNVVDIALSKFGVKVSNPQRMFRRPPNIITYAYDVLPDGSGIIGRRWEEFTQPQQIDLWVDWRGVLP
jgi:Tol biopolymer transport system component